MEATKLRGWAIARTRENGVEEIAFFHPSLGISEAFECSNTQAGRFYLGFLLSPSAFPIMRFLIPSSQL
jgi:hypothetical protein